MKIGGLEREVSTRCGTYGTTRMRFHLPIGDEYKFSFSASYEHKTRVYILPIHLHTHEPNTPNAQRSEHTTASNAIWGHVYVSIDLPRKDKAPRPFAGNVVVLDEQVKGDAHNRELTEKELEQRLAHVVQWRQRSLACNPSS